LKVVAGKKADVDCMPVYVHCRACLCPLLRQQPKKSRKVSDLR
jgi:hypothetical protein